jgi:hypothetical protein
VVTGERSKMECLFRARCGFTQGFYVFILLGARLEHVQWVTSPFPVEMPH